MVILTCTNFTATFCILSTIRQPLHILYVNKPNGRLRAPTSQVALTRSILIRFLKNYVFKTKDYVLAVNVVRLSTVVSSADQIIARELSYQMK